ncbi:MAG: SLC13 family permease [Thioalkalivibrionaceae bacterium]
METLNFTVEMALVLALLGVAITLFAFDLLRVDLAALSVLFALALTLLIPGIEPLVEPDVLFSGFASNAVIAIIAVMILGAGLDRSGVLQRLANGLLQIAGRTERRVTATVCSAVGVISAFFQNIGAAALFLPALGRIADATGVPIQRLLMPMGFAAITGGTLTLVASSPLILLNDLMPDRLEPFSLFDVTPIGLALLATVIVYFLVLGRFVLPNATASDGHRSRARTIGRYFRETYGLDYDVHEVHIGEDSALAGLTIGQFERDYRVFVIGIHDDGLTLDPARDVTIQSGSRLAFMGPTDRIEKLCDDTATRLHERLDVFAQDLSPRHSGVAELLVGPDSPFIGKTVADVGLRRHLGLGLLRIQRGDEAIRHDFADVKLQAGDLLVAHTRWKRLAEVERDRALIVLTSRYPKAREEPRRRDVFVALTGLIVAVGLVLFSDLPLSASLLGGALIVILGGVLSMDQAYGAISWKTIFLLACLIPLGLAVQDTGTGEFIAQRLLGALADTPPWALLAAVFVLTSLFSLVLTNVGATVLMVPLAIQIAELASADARVFALAVGIAASNAFLLPTHQVNALILDPGGYKVADFIRAGAPLTVLYAIVAIIMIQILFK